jgi:membrane fusion protein (multidrug efflux system)
MAIVPLDDVWVTANFKETQLDHIHAGQAAEIKVDAYGGLKFNARVDSIASATGATFSLLPAENASGNFVKVVQRVPVKLVITDKLDSSRTLRPGMSVEVKVLTEERKN